jgi:hypothetical protein
MLRSIWVFIGHRQRLMVAAVRFFRAPLHRGRKKHKKLSHRGTKQTSIFLVASGPRDK